MLLLLAVAAHAQPRFDVASVKVTTERNNDHLHPRVRITPGRIDFNVVSIGGIFHQAWPDLAPYQIVWPKKFPFQTTYQISATMPKNTSPAQLQLMVQTLLTERFNLQIHWQQRNLPVYLLEVSSHGLKLRRSAHPPPDNSLIVINHSDENWTMYRRVFDPAADPEARRQRYSTFTIGDLINFFQGQPYHERPLLDRTGLTGYFDFDFRPPCSPDGCYSKQWSDDIFFDYIEKNFGLHVERKLAPTRMLIVDHVNAIPTPN